MLCLSLRLQEKSQQNHENECQCQPWSTNIVFMPDALQIVLLGMVVSFLSSLDIYIIQDSPLGPATSNLFHVLEIITSCYDDHKIMIDLMTHDVHNAFPAEITDIMWPVGVVKVAMQNSDRSKEKHVVLSLFPENILPKGLVTCYKAAIAIP